MVTLDRIPPDLSGSHQFQILRDRARIGKNHLVKYARMHQPAGADVQGNIRQMPGAAVHERIQEQIRAAVEAEAPAHDGLPVVEFRYDLISGTAFVCHVLTHPDLMIPCFFSMNPMKSFNPIRGKDFLFYPHSGAAPESRLQTGRRQQKEPEPPDTPAWIHPPGSSPPPPFRSPQI